MPKDNEVDEKAVKRYVAEIDMLTGVFRCAESDEGGWVNYDDHAATVAELRAEVERLRSQVSYEFSERELATKQRDDAWEREAAHKQRADAAERRVRELEADALELREELEQSQRNYALLANESIYDGNSIGWIASKAKNYGDALLLAWGAVKEVGGTCDGNTPLHEAIRKQLTKADK